MRWKHTVKFSLVLTLLATWAMMAGQPAWGPVAPVINSVTPNPTFAGNTVTVAGTGFGATQGTSTLLYDGAALAITSWADTQIQAVLPTPKSVGTYNVQLNKGGVLSNIVTHSINMDVPPFVMLPLIDMIMMD